MILKQEKFAIKQKIGVVKGEAQEDALRGSGRCWRTHEMSIHGIHDDEWIKEMHKKFPESLIFRAWARPESLTEREMFRAVSMTGDAWIALEWVRRREKCPNE